MERLYILRNDIFRLARSINVSQDQPLVGNNLLEKEIEVRLKEYEGYIKTVFNPLKPLTKAIKLLILLFMVFLMIWLFATIRALKNNSWDTTILKSGTLMERHTKHHFKGKRMVDCSIAENKKDISCLYYQRYKPHKRRREQSKYTEEDLLTTPADSERRLLPKGDQTDLNQLPLFIGKHMFILSNKSNDFDSVFYLKVFFSLITIISLISGIHCYVKSKAEKMINIKLSHLIEVNNKTDGFKFKIVDDYTFIKVIIKSNELPLETSSVKQGDKSIEE